MPLHTYRALTPKGTLKRGNIEATSLLEAREQLHMQGLLPLECKAQTSWQRPPKLTGQSLITFTEQLSQLLRAGLPLVEALSSLEEEMSGERTQSILIDLRKQILEGNTFAQALATYPKSFDSLYRSLIQAGEAGGSLVQALDYLSLLLKKHLSMKRQLISALTYPILLSLFALSVITILLTFVLPSIEMLFDEKQTNGLTAFLFSISHFVTNHGVALLATFCGILGGLWGLFRTPTAQRSYNRLLITLPLLKTLTIKKNLAIFFRTLASLQKGGLNLIDSLRLAQNALRHLILREKFFQIEQAMVEGTRLSEQLRNEPLIPPLVTRMIAIGEKSGELASMSEKLAELYEEETERLLRKITSLLQPIILILMAAIIGIIMLAVLLPLTDVQAIL